MGALERKLRFLFVVELGSRPSVGGMAARTIDGSRVLELASMNILMAGIAFLGRFEWNVAQFLARVAHLVTSQACDRTVPARQGKLGQAMIERLQLLPGNYSVTRLTDAIPGVQMREDPSGIQTRIGSPKPDARRGAGTRHYRRWKFSLMRVFVACLAHQTGEVIGRDGAHLVTFFMAVLAGYCGMRSSETET